MPKAVDHDAYREELLERCFDLFGRKGFSNVTMREIATEIGVSTGTLYHYFPTKVSILEQMFSWAVKVDTGALGREARTDAPRSDRTGRLADFWLGNLPHYRNLLLLALDLLRNGSAGSEAVFREYAGQYRSAIARALGSDGRRSSALFTYAVGLVVESLLIPGEFASREHPAVVRDAVKSLCSRGGGTRAAPRAASSAAPPGPKRGRGRARGRPGTTVPRNAARKGRPG